MPGSGQDGFDGVGVEASPARLLTQLTGGSVRTQGGTLRALAVTGEKRIDSLPDVPTMIESGYPGQTGETPVGIYVQAGTPAEIVEVLRSKVVKIVAMPDVKQKLAAVGFVPIGDTPEEFAAYLKAEGEKWGKVIRDGNIKLQ